MADKIKKTPCPISRDHFKAHAKPIIVVVDGKSYSVDPLTFATKSLGWRLSEKAGIKVGGTPVKVQIGLCVTVVGSKQLPL